MKEKVKQLLIAMNLEVNDANHDLVMGWIRTNCAYVSDVFKVNENLYGKEKQMDFIMSVKKSALKMGELSLRNCGRHRLEENEKDGKYHLVEFLVFNLQTPQDKETFETAGDVIQGKSQSRIKLLN